MSVWDAICLIQSVKWRVKGLMIKNMESGESPSKGSFLFRENYTVYYEQ